VTFNPSLRGSGSWGSSISEVERKRSEVPRQLNLGGESEGAQKSVLEIKKSSWLWSNTVLLMHRGDSVRPRRRSYWLIVSLTKQTPQGKLWRSHGMGNHRNLAIHSEETLLNMIIFLLGAQRDSSSVLRVTPGPIEQTLESKPKEILLIFQ
jgi:hypothetical protein